jgi:hypothetical protein
MSVSSSAYMREGRRWDENTMDYYLVLINSIVIRHFSFVHITFATLKIGILLSRTEGQK